MVRRLKISKSCIAIVPLWCLPSSDSPTLIAYNIYRTRHIKTDVYAPSSLSACLLRRVTRGDDIKQCYQPPRRVILLLGVIPPTPLRESLGLECVSTSALFRQSSLCTSGSTSEPSCFTVVQDVSFFLRRLFARPSCASLARFGGAGSVVDGASTCETSARCFEASAGGDTSGLSPCFSGVVFAGRVGLSDWLRGVLGSDS